MVRRLGLVLFPVAFTISAASALSGCKAKDAAAPTGSSTTNTSPVAPPPCTPVDGNPDPTLTPATNAMTFRGTVTLTAASGTPPYTYSISSGKGSISSAGVFSGIGSGTSVVKVTDSLCHSATASVTVGAPVPSTRTPNDTLYSQLFGMTNIDAPSAWAIQNDCRSLVVGVIDTGIDYTHAELSPNLWTNPGETASNGIDDDANGYTDDTMGWNFYDGTNDPKDNNFHGTHVSGTIAAYGNNATGVTGICWRAKLMALKFLDANGSGYTSDAISAVNYGRVKGAKVLNNSWGGAGFSQALKDAIDQAGTAGIVFVAAAGNAHQNLDTTPSYPASFTSSNVISVAAVTNTDALASYSNYGASTVPVAAPGSSIKSTFPTVATAAMTTEGLATDYETISGTSMACPHVAGIAALLLSLDSTLTVAQVRSRFYTTIDNPNTTLRGKVVYGRVNAGRVLNPGL